MTQHSSKSDKVIKMQIVDFYTENMVYKNEENSDSDESVEDFNSKFQLDESKYKIMLFGKDEFDKTYSVLVDEFTPYFYLKMPDTFTKDKIKYLEVWLKENMWNKHEDGLLRITLHKKMSFRGFTNKKKFNFVRLVFQNTNAMNNCINLFQNKTWNPVTKKISKILPKKVNITGITGKPEIFDLYENMIDPMIRFIHHREIKPVGWISISKYKIRDFEHPTNCNVNIVTRWTDINYLENENNVGIKIMAYDIECDSSHGDFPLPIKDYLKLTREIVLEYERIQKNLITKDVNQLELEKYQYINKNKKGFIKKLLTAAFNNGDEEFNISRVYIKEGYNKPKEEIINNVSGKILNYIIDYDPTLKTLDRSKIIEKSIDNINNKILNRFFPPVEGDKTIQIGTSFIKYGESKPYRNVMYTLGTCDKIENTETISFKTEKELLLEFRKLIIEEDPEVITGYNINGFDTPWLMKRAQELDIEEFCKLSRLNDYNCVLKEKQEKSGIGQLIKVEFVDIPGRIQLDILKLVQKSYNLDSYKLDSVSANFIQGDIKDIIKVNNKTVIKTNNLKGLNIGNYIVIVEQDGYLENKYLDGKKFEIKEIIDNSFVINEEINIDLNKKSIWCLGKDDVSPQDIFRLQKGNSHDRFIIAKYCMMDVILCIELLLKLELLTNSIGMANVCLIPLNWSIHRGQGVKLLSLVTEVLRKENYLLPYLYKSLISKEGYEGAIVLPPYPGIYLDDPVAVLDYASLYPSSMIMGNLSHETICEDDKWYGDEGILRLKNLGYGYHDVTYDTFQTIFTSSGSVKEKKKIGEKTVRYVQYSNNEKGLIPRTLQHLLNARKSTRKKINYKTVTLKNGQKYSGLKNESEQNIIIITEKNDKIEINKDDIIDITDTYNKFQQNVLDGLQLAFKITANSLYGQIGAKVSDLFYREIAASTTSIGRQQLDIAQTYCENQKHFPKILDNGETIYLQNKCVYGDTDSVFVKFDCRYNNGEKMIGKDALAETIKLAKIAEFGIKKILMKPQDLEYEKTFWPFILFTKKRYVGNKYEFDIEKYKQTSMGIVTKRRDNAPICKVIFGGIIDIIMKEKNIIPSIDFLRKTLNDLITNKFNLDTLIISKTLSSYYKDPDRIAHKVLANRMAQRDPGNKPQTNDRIPFVYINIDEKNFKGTILQGDKIEHPTFIKENNLFPDYEFYITNQIMKPVCQIYGLCLETIPGYVSNINYSELQEKYEKTFDRLSATKKILEKKQKIAGNILFGEVLRTIQNKKSGNTEITKWFSTSSKSNNKKNNTNKTKVSNSYISDNYELDDELYDELDNDYDLNI